MHAITFLDSTRNSAQIIAKHFEEGFKDSSFVCSSQSPVSGTLRLILFHLHLPVSAFFYSNPVCPSQSLPFRGRCANNFIFTYPSLLFFTPILFVPRRVSRFGDAALDTTSSSLTDLCFFLLRSCASFVPRRVSRFGALRLILFHLHLPVSAFFYSNPVCPSQSLPFRGLCANNFIFTYPSLLFFTPILCFPQRPRGGRL
jgi:hypothetical protein